MKFEVDHEKLQQYYERLCPCLIPNRDTAIQENICPCRMFINEGKCRCGLFKEVKE